MSDELVLLRQGTGGLINVSHDVDGVPFAGITAAKYQLFGRDDEVLLTLTLGSGISFNAGIVAITITTAQAASLAGLFTHQCAVIDSIGRDIIALDGPIQFKPRK